MPAPASLLGRQARVVVSPKPITLSETCNILTVLHSFGPVSHFFNPRYVPALKLQSQDTFYVNFTESSSLDNALAATPFTVEVGDNTMDPEEADPFNVRGFWDRKKLERKTFRCAVFDHARSQRPNARWNQQLREGNPYHGPFRVDRLAVSFQDLMRQGVPFPEIADSFQKRHLGEPDRARFEQEAGRSSFYTTVESGETTGGLMERWRENAKSEEAIGQVEGEKGHVGS